MSFNILSETNLIYHIKIKSRCNFRKCFIKKLIKIYNNILNNLNKDYSIYLVGHYVTLI